MQRKTADGSSVVADVPASPYHVLRTPGTPLDAAARAFLEPRFNRDFSSVRVHAAKRPPGLPPKSVRPPTRLGRTSPLLRGAMPRPPMAAGNCSRMNLPTSSSSNTPSTHRFGVNPKPASAAPPVAAPAPGACKTSYTKARFISRLDQPRARRRNRLRRRRTHHAQGSDPRDSRQLLRYPLEPRFFRREKPDAQ